MRHLCALFGLALWFTAPTVEPAAEPWTPEDYITMESAGGFQISPDGRKALWEKGTVDLEGQRRVSQLQLTDIASNETIQLTRGEQSSSGAKWSPDGKTIAFLTTRPIPKGKTVGRQIWLIRSGGGEAWPLTKGERSVSAYWWADNGKIVFSAQESKSLYEAEIAEKKDTSNPIDDEEHEPPVRLFSVTVPAGKVERLSKNLDRIQGLWVSPDGKLAVTSQEQSLRYGYDQKIRPKAFLWNIETGSSEEILKDRKINLGTVEWRPDSNGFYFSSSYTTSPNYVMASEERLYAFNVASKQYEEIPLRTGKGLLFGSIEATPDGVLAILEDGTKTKVAHYRKLASAWEKRDISGEHVSNTFGAEISNDGRTLLYAYSTASAPEQWFVATLDGTKLSNGKAITQINPALKEKRFTKTETIRWKGAKNQEVEGLLYYPLDFESGKKYPLVLMIHGGPLGHDADTWNDSMGTPAHLFAQRGAFVLMPNYHGSSGYGLEFAESIADGGYYTLPLEDILKGVNWLVARGNIDANKLGTMGWSNGAILSAALIVKDPRYKAASVGAGGAEWVADWGSCAFGQAFSNYYLGKAPVEDPDLYRKNAPLFEFGKVRTPTIFFHGTEDTAVPTHHSWVQYRTLQYLGKVDTKLVLFPGEPHGIGKPAHRLRKIEEELAWFDKYLFEVSPTDPKNEALKEGSRLEDAVALASAKRSGPLFGEAVSGVLTPEFVSFKNLQVGRFEVTRAQYAAFDNAYALPAGTENYPANGISFDKAKEYCAWLAAKLGKSCRLPNEDEAGKLYSGGSNENTLDAWAGYSVNPDDATKLLKVMEKLPGKAPLLKEVGSFSGTGKEAKVFDLGGNVAEWVVMKSGAGEPKGGSAATPADSKTKINPPAEYIGFRVVIG